MHYSLTYERDHEAGLWTLAVTVLWPSCQAQAQGSGARCSGSQSSMNEAFAKAAITLRSKTPIPLRLPTCVLGLHSEEGPYAIVKSADESGYVVVLGATPDCQGQHACSYGTMIGTSRPLDRIDEYDVTRRPRSAVRLRGGLKGYFYPPVCGVYCSDSFITWTEGTYHYMIGLKAETRPSLLASANSAIESAGAK